jgi:hypothetical protein
MIGKNKINLLLANEQTKKDREPLLAAVMRCNLPGQSCDIPAGVYKLTRRGTGWG